jgi:hypothetical protein
MSTFIGFGPTGLNRASIEKEPIRLINFDQIREIVVTSPEDCVVHFSETDRRVFHGPGATELLDIVTRMLPDNVVTEKMKRDRAARQPEA